jgi:hypothetical protein
VKTNETFHNSLPINNDLYEFLNEINYGLTAKQMNNIYSLVEGIICLKGTKSILRISKEVIAARECCSLYRYLKNSEWLDELIDRNRLVHLDLFSENNIQSKRPGFFIIDDTVNPKKKAQCMEGLSFNHSHTEGKRIKSHCIVSSQFVCGSVSNSLNYKFYLSEDNCIKHDRVFKGKSDIACDFVKNLNKPSHCSNVYCLVDSWYTSEKLIKSCIQNQMHLIGAIRKNRLITPTFTRIQIGEFFKALPEDIFDVVTIDDVNYKAFDFTATLGKSGDITVKVVLSYEIKKDGTVIPLYLISTDTSLSARQIILYYLKRWNIEVDYKHFKSDLGFDEYKIRDLRAIERYLLIVFLAMNFLQIYHFKHKSSVKTIGDCIEAFINDRFRLIIDYVYDNAARGCPKGQLYESLKVFI